MPREILTEAPDGLPLTGFHGKLASTGDFVTRGLPDSFRRRWDDWITRHLAPRQRDGSTWPEGGIRFRLRSGGRVAAGVILPGHDSAGRLFPLSLILIADRLPGPGRLDIWCDAACALPANNTLDPEALWRALDRLPPPAMDEALPDALPDLLLWSKFAAPLPGAPAKPDATLAALFA